jgi:predicted DCC family thiol-disulfide oxidoreductase YuxK
MATERVQPPPDGRHWVLWDGDCSLCRRSIDWAAARDARDRLTFIPYQRAPRPPMTAELERRCSEAVHVITVDGRLLAAGRASMFVLGVLGWRRLAWLLSRPPLIWAIEIGYRLVARHRPFFDRFLFR